MPTVAREDLLCCYYYDALDRLIDSELPTAAHTYSRYYCKEQLATEIDGDIQTSLFRHDDLPLAQLQSQSSKVEATLLATDLQRSILNTLKQTHLQPMAYTPYGHRPAQNGLLSLLGFNGQRRDPLTGCYLLGNGYRVFNPVLMRFNSPDNWSPFGSGGLNAYAYCEGEPVMRFDDTGHNYIARLFGIVGKSNFKSVKGLKSYMSKPELIGQSGGPQFYLRVGSVNGVSISSAQQVKSFGRLSKERLVQVYSSVDNAYGTNLKEAIKGQSKGLTARQFKKIDPVLESGKNFKTGKKADVYEPDLRSNGSTLESTFESLNPAQKNKKIRYLSNEEAKENARHRNFRVALLKS